MNEYEKPVDAATVTREVALEKLRDAETPGFWADFSPDEAELAGAFEEATLTAEDAVATDIDRLAAAENDVGE
jgi:hypothetical protein